MKEQHIERVGQEMAKLDLAGHVLAWDRKQAKDVWDADQHKLVPNAAARRCPVHPEHGILQMHGQGHALVCPVARPTPCEYSEPVSR